MEVSEFKRILEIGLGRAILFLQTHDATPYREVILEACLHDTRQDSIMEYRRSTYLFEVITLTGSLEFFREPILQALKNAPDPNAKDTNQLVGLATCFAEQGDQEARQLVYDDYVAHLTSDNCNGFLRSHDLITLDGVDGFLFAAEWFGKRLPEVTKYSSPYFFPREKEEWDEQDWAYWDASTRRAVDNPYLAAYVEFEQRRQQEPPRSRRRKPLSSLPYDKFKHAIPIADRGFWLGIWGEKANEADLELAANDLLALDMQTDLELLRKYLSIFSDRRFPLDPQKLIDLASQARNGPPSYDEHDVYTPHTRLTIAALNALANIAHPSVRQLAFDLLESPQWITHAGILLKSNWQISDWYVLETLTRESFDSWDFHGLGTDIQKIFDDHPGPEAAPTLLNLYEYGPCSECRQRIVEALESIQAVPEWMRAECRYDANLDLREWAEGGE